MRMPRLARTVFARIPHHITQRGNRREDIFFTDDDRETYLAWLKDYSDQHDVAILAYCLMSNHIHLVAVPRTKAGLQAVLKPLHMRYAQRLNRQRGLHGHVWQGRYFSSPLDPTYTWACIRYVERNPVRARIVRKAENYRWSSAAAHCKLRDDDILTTDPRWLRQLRQVNDWSGWLAQGDAPDELTILRRHVERGLPCGTKAFIGALGKRAGRDLNFRPPGRPVKG